MPCSAVTLSIGTIFAIISVTLLSIAFATDNWLYVDVKRANIQAYLNTHTGGETRTVLDDINSKYYYYTRTQGLFRICYPKERPPTVKTYLSPVETHCNNVNYYFPDTNNETADFSEDAMTRLHMGRSVIALIILSLLITAISWCVGIAGCWRRSAGRIAATAALALLSTLLSAAAMGLWHCVDYYEREKLVGEEFYQQWSNVLRENVEITYEWSFVCGWLSVLTGLISTIFFSGGAQCLSNEIAEEQAQANIQYIMPVYPQKQQYAYASYPAPQAYPGPYYTHSSQYGPYNY